MKENIKIFVNDLFDKVPKNEKTLELKEEIYSNAIDKYDDLIKMGVGEDEAYRAVVSNIGDIDGLISEYNEIDKENLLEKKRNAKRTSIAIMLYILSPVPIVFLRVFSPSPKVQSVGVILLLILVAVATGILVYGKMLNIDIKNEEECYTIASGVKERNLYNYQRIKIRKTIKSIIGSLTFVVYFIVSYVFGGWIITWVIFIIGYAVSELIMALFDLKEVR